MITTKSSHRTAQNGEKKMPMSAAAAAAQWYNNQSQFHLVGDRLTQFW